MQLTCPRCHRPRRPALVTTSGKLFSFPKKLVLPTGRRGMMLAAGAALCCCCTDQFLRPDADLATDGFAASGGGSLYLAIDETVASDADYIWREIDSATYVAKLSLTAGTDPGFDTGHVLRLRAKFSGVTMGTRSVALRKSDGTLIAALILTALTSSFADFSLALTTGQAALITDYTTLEIWITGGARTSTDIISPDSTVSNQWDINGAATAHQAVLAAGDSASLTTNVLDETFEVGLGNPPDPPTLNTDHEFWLDTSGGAKDWELKQGGTVIESWSQTTSGTHAFAAANIANITDYTDLRIKGINKVNGGLGSQVDRVFVRIPQRSELHVSWVELAIECP